jgi:hypothetical protein
MPHELILQYLNVETWGIILFLGHVLVLGHQLLHVVVIVQLRINTVLKGVLGRFAIQSFVDISILLSFLGLRRF